MAYIYICRIYIYIYTCYRPKQVVPKTCWKKKICMICVNPSSSSYLSDS